MLETKEHRDNLSRHWDEVVWCLSYWSQMVLQQWWVLNFSGHSCIFVLLIVNLSQGHIVSHTSLVRNSGSSWWLLPLVISCHVIILRISHHPGSFCTSEKMRRKLYLYPATPTLLGQNINCQTLGWEFRDGNVFRVWRHCARVLYCLLSAPSYSRDFLKRWYNQMLGRYSNKIPVIPLLNLDQIVSATILTATIISRHFITWMFKI